MINENVKIVLVKFLQEGKASFELFNCDLATTPRLAQQSQPMQKMVQPFLIFNWIWCECRWHVFARTRDVSTRIRLQTIHRCNRRTPYSLQLAVAECLVRPQ